MKKQQRDRALKRLASMIEGEALVDYLEEQINKMTDARQFSVTDFEVDGRAAVKAAEVIRKTVHVLKIGKADSIPKQHKDYV